MSSQNLSDIFGDPNRFPKPERPIGDLMDEFSSAYGNARATDAQGNPVKEFDVDSPEAKAIMSQGQYVPPLQLKQPKKQVNPWDVEGLDVRQYTQEEREKINLSAFDNREGGGLSEPMAVVLKSGEVRAMQWNAGSGQWQEIGAPSKVPGGNLGRAIDERNKPLLGGSRNGPFEGLLKLPKLPDAPVEDDNAPAKGMDMGMTVGQAREKRDAFNRASYLKDTNQYVPGEEPQGQFVQPEDVIGVTDLDTALQVGGEAAARGLPVSAAAMAGATALNEAILPLPIPAQYRPAAQFGATVIGGATAAGASALGLDWLIPMSRQSSLSALGRPVAQAVGAYGQQLALSGPISLRSAFGKGPKMTWAERLALSKEQAGEELGEGLGDRTIQELQNAMQGNGFSVGNVFSPKEMFTDAAFGALVPHSTHLGDFVGGAGQFAGAMAGAAGRGAVNAVRGPQTPQGLVIPTGSSIGQGPSIADIVAQQVAQNAAQPQPSATPPLQRNQQNSLSPSGAIPPANLGNVSVADRGPTATDTAASAPFRNMNIFDGASDILPPQLRRPDEAKVDAGDSGVNFAPAGTNGFTQAAINVETALPGEPTTQNLPLTGQMSYHRNLMGESGGDKGIIPMTVEITRQFGLDVGPIDNEAVGYWRDSDTGVLERNPATQFNVVLPPSAVMDGKVSEDFRKKLDAVAASAAAAGGQKGISWILPVNGDRDPNSWYTGVQISSGTFPRLDVYGVTAISDEISRIIKEEKNIQGNVDIGVVNMPNGLRFIDWTGSNWDGKRVKGKGVQRTVYTDANGNEVQFGAEYLADVVARAYNNTIGKHYGSQYVRGRGFPEQTKVHLFNFDSNYFEAGGAMMPEGSRLTPAPESAETGPYGKGYSKRLAGLSPDQRRRLDAGIADANATRRALAGNADPGFEGVRYDANGLPFNPDLTRVNATNLRTDEAGRVAAPARPALRREVNVPTSRKLGRKGGELQGRETSDFDMAGEKPPQTTYEQDAQTATKLTPASSGGMNRPETATVEREKDVRLGQRAAQEIVRNNALPEDARGDTSQQKGIIQELNSRYGVSEPMRVASTTREHLLITHPDNQFNATSERAGEVLKKIGEQSGEKLTFRVSLDNPTGITNAPNTSKSSNQLKVQVINEDGNIISQSLTALSMMGGQVQVGGARLDTAEAYQRKDLAFAVKAEALQRVSQALHRSAFTGYMRLKMGDVSTGSASTRANVRAAEPALKGGKATLQSDSGTKTMTVSEIVAQLRLSREYSKLADEVSDGADEAYQAIQEQNRGRLTSAEIDRKIRERERSLAAKEEFLRKSAANIRSRGLTAELKIGTQLSETPSLSNETPEQKAKTDKEKALEAKMEHAQKMIERIEGLRGTPRFDMMGGQKSIDGQKAVIDQAMQEMAQMNGVDLDAHAKEVAANLDAEAARQRGETVPETKPGLERAVGGVAEGLDRNAQQSLGDNRQEMMDNFESDSMQLDDAGKRLAGKIINGTDVRGALQELAKGSDIQAKLAKIILKVADARYLAKTVSAFKNDAQSGTSNGYYLPGGPARIAGDAAKGDRHTTEGAIGINYEALMEPNGSEKSARRIVMHEIVHALVSDAVNRSIYGRVATMSANGQDVMGITGKSYLDRLRAYVKSNSSLQNVGVSRIIQAYLKYYSTLPQNIRDMYESGMGGDSTGNGSHRRLMDAGAQYGAVSVNEFVAEAFMNPDFAQILQQIPMGKTNLFTMFKNAVAKVLGINTASESNLLSEVIDAGLQTSATPLSEINKPGRAYDKALTDVKAERMLQENRAAGGNISEKNIRTDAEIDVASQRQMAESEKGGASDIQADLDRAIADLKKETNPNMKRRLADEVLRLETELMASHKEAMDRIEANHTPEEMAQLQTMAEERGIDLPTPDQLNMLAKIREQQMALTPTMSEVDAVRRKARADDRFAEAQRLKREGKITDDEAMAADELALENELAMSGEDSVQPTFDSTASMNAAEEARRLRDEGVTPHTPKKVGGQESATQRKQRLADERRARENDNLSPDGWSVNDVLNPSTKGLSRTEQLSLMDDIKSGKFLKREALDSKRRVQAIVEVLRRGKMSPKEAAKWGARTMMDLVTLKFIASNQAELLTLADRTGSRAALAVYRMLNGGVPGRTEDPAVGQAYHSAVSTQTMQFKNKLADAINEFESELKDMDRDGQRAFLEEVGRLVAAGERDSKGNWVPTLPSDPKKAKLVTEIRSIYREMHAYQVRAGIEVGNWGGTYLPRMLNNEYVINNREEFIKAATEAYKTTGMDDFDAGKAAMHWYDAVLRGDSGFTYGSDFIFDGATLNGEPKHTRDRVFGPEGEAVLERFYNRNILDATNAYINRAVRNAEVSRRFGEDFGRYRDLQNQFIEEGNSEKLNQLNNLVAAQLGAVTSSNNTDSALLNFLQTYSAIHFLPRATFSSLSEPAILAVRTGNVMDAFTAYYDSAKQFLRQVTNASPDYHTKLAEDLGVVLGHLADSATTSSIESRYFSEHSRRGGAWVTNQFFRRTGLSQWTEGTRVAAVKMGETFINRLANDVLDMNNTQMSSHRFLRELGIQDVRGFAQFVRDLNSGKSKRDDVRRQAIMSKNGKHAEAYRQALVRFAEQTIMNPNQGTRPRWASHPLGGVIFNLQSYLYAFHENVTKRTVRLAGSAIDPRSNMTMQDRARMAAPIGILAASSIIQYLLGELRKQLFNDPARRYDPDDSEATKWGRAVSRANLFGRYDFALNALLSLKYDKEPATVMAGPVLGSFSEAFKAMSDTMSASNSPNTNTAERRAARMGYDLLAQPALNAVFSTVPGGWLGGAVGAGGIQASSHPGTREFVVENVAGPPVAPKKRKPNTSFWDDVLPE